MDPTTMAALARAYMRRKHWEAILTALEIGKTMGGEAGADQLSSGNGQAAGYVRGRSGKQYQQVTPEQFLMITGGN